MAICLLLCTHTFPIVGVTGEGWMKWLKVALFIIFKVNVVEIGRDSTNTGQLWSVRVFEFLTRSNV